MGKKSAINSVYRDSHMNSDSSSDIGFEVHPFARTEVGELLR